MSVTSLRAEGHRLTQSTEIVPENSQIERRVSIVEALLLAPVAATESTSTLIKCGFEFPTRISGDEIGVDGRLVLGMGGFDPDVISAAASEVICPRFGGPTALEAAGGSLAVDRPADIAVALAGRGFDFDSVRHSEVTDSSDLSVRIQ